jgi:ferritin-like metal-binding protein YciE
MADKQTLKDLLTDLEKAAELLGVKATGRKCVGMEGIVKEGAEALGEDGTADVLDLGIIGAGSRVEHYEIAGYLTAISLAHRMNAAEVVVLLQQSLTEEQGAEQKLRKIAGVLIKTASSGELVAGFVLTKERLFPCSFNS